MTEQAALQQLGQFFTRAVDDLRNRKYQVYGACPLPRAIEMYRSRFAREPQLIVAHPKQVAVCGGIAVGAKWAMCAKKIGQGPWYLEVP